jgi:hypothetical protein
MNKDFDIEACGLGYNTTGYPGAFTDPVNKIIKNTISGRVLNLFSGVSLIGDVRVDLLRPEATHNCDVFDFIKNNTEVWNFVIADPPYAIKSAPHKLKIYGSTKPFNGNILYQREMAVFLKRYAKNVLWLDMCAPLPDGFKRVKVWLLLPGGWFSIRVLSYLTNIHKLSTI